MTGSIILNQNNLNATGYFDARNTPAPYWKYGLNMRGLNLTGKKIGLKKANLYYSWPNIVKTQTVTIAWPNGATYTNFDWTLPAQTNYESIDVLNQALQDFCIANGLYLVNGSSNVYYLELVANPVNYKVSLNLLKIPTALPGSFTQPANFAGYPSTSKTAKFTIPANSELAKLIGFDDNTTYNGDTSALQANSVYVPQLANVSTVYITCNVAKNDVPINGSTVIATFTTHGVSYGQMIMIEPAMVDFYEIDTNSNLLEIAFWDQNWNQLYIQDPQTTIQLIVK